MDAASAALDSLFKKTPAPGTRDGTSVADTEGGQKTEQMADQAGQKLEEAGSEIKQKAGEASSAIGDKANEASSKAGTTGTTSGSASAVSGSTSTTSGATTDAPSVDKVTEETNTAETQEVAPAVEHDKITREHETRERDVVEKEVHKDHYHTTVQPLKDREVEDTEHKFEQAPTEYRETDKDDGAAKAQAEKNLSGFQDTVEEGKTKETEAKDETVMGEHVHHHMHEIIQPVIEKGKSIH